MQQTKWYKESLWKGGASRQFEKDLRKMTKHGWHVQKVTDEVAGKEHAHVGNLKVIYEK